jgi:hypothetical protein
MINFSLNFLFGCLRFGIEMCEAAANENTKITLSRLCQTNAENFGLADQNQVQSAYWSTKYISIFTAYVWMGGSDGEGQAFGLVSNSTQHDKYLVSTCLEIFINEIISMMPDVSKIFFFGQSI